MMNSILLKILKSDSSLEFMKNPDTPGFREEDKRFNQLMDEISPSLNEVQKELLDCLLTSHLKLTEYEWEQSFVRGARLGANLMFEMFCEEVGK